jgi:hypothetical protein
MKFFLKKEPFPSDHVQMIATLWELSKNIFKKDIYPGGEGGDIWKNDSFDHRSICKEGKNILRKEHVMKHILCLKGCSRCLCHSDSNLINQPALIPLGPNNIKTV